MLTREKAAIVVLWVALRLKKLAAAGLVCPTGKPHMEIAPAGEAHLQRYLLEHAPPNEQDVFQACQHIFSATGPLAGTPRDQVEGLIHLILKWRE